MMIDWNAETPRSCLSLFGAATLVLQTDGIRCFWVLLLNLLLLTC